jgi:hypothetical protein
VAVSFETEQESMPAAERDGSRETAARALLRLLLRPASASVQ